MAEDKGKSKKKKSNSRFHSPRPTPGPAGTKTTQGPTMAASGYNPTLMGLPERGGLQIQIYHIPTQKTAEFAAFITNFSDSYSPNWDSQQVFGRPDPMMNFMNTTRNISLSWDIPAADFQEAKANMAEVNKLLQFLYPTYSGTGHTRTMEGSPLVKIQFQNLIVSSAPSFPYHTEPTKDLRWTPPPVHPVAAEFGAAQERLDEKLKKSMLEQQQGSAAAGAAAATPADLDVDAKANGLIAAITSCTATPDFDVGFFSGWNEVAGDAEPQFQSNPDKKKHNRYPSSHWPKLWRIDISFTVLHDHDMGSF